MSATSSTRSAHQLRISAAMKLHWRGRKGRSKYRAQPIILDGIRFASKREGNRWGQLKLLERAGKISGLQCQPVFELAPAIKFAGSARAKPALRYIADFAYVEGGKHVIEDVKGILTAAFVIKRHLMKSVHNIDVRIVK